MSFQCCAVFGAIVGAKLYYLDVGDCRIAVRRGQSLYLLNGTLWVDTTGNPLPPLIVGGQAVRRGPETPPSQVLGVRPEYLSPSQVEEFSLERDDQVLVYSDGVDKVVSPTQLLEVLTNGNQRGGLEEIVKEVMKEVDINLGDDDRTFLIAGGPHEGMESNAIIRERTDRLNTQQSLSARLSKIEDDMKNVEEFQKSLNSLLQYAHHNKESIEALTKQLKDLMKSRVNDGPSTKVAELDKKLSNYIDSYNDELFSVRKEVADLKKGLPVSKHVSQQEKTQTRETADAGSKSPVSEVGSGAQNIEDVGMTHQFVSEARPSAAATAETDEIRPSCYGV